MIRIPIHLGAISFVDQVFQRKPVQSFLVTQHPDNIPTQTIDVDPPALHPGLPLSGHKLLYCVVIECILAHFILREVHYSDIAPTM